MYVGWRFYLQGLEVEVNFSLQFGLRGIEGGGKTETVEDVPEPHTAQALRDSLPVG